MRYSGLGKSRFKNGSPDSGEDRIRGIIRILVKEDMKVIISHNNGIKETMAVSLGKNSILIREDYLEHGVSGQYILHLTHKNEKQEGQILVTFIRVRDDLITNTSHFWGWANVRTLN